MSVAANAFFPLAMRMMTVHARTQLVVPAVIELKQIINLFMTRAAVDFRNSICKYTIEHRYMGAVMAGKTCAVIPIRSFYMSRMALRARRYLESCSVAVLAGFIPVTASSHFFPESLLGQFFKS